jgi:hypothetical protein
MHLKRFSGRSSKVFLGEAGRAAKHTELSDRTQHQPAYCHESAHIVVSC